MSQDGLKDCHSAEHNEARYSVLNSTELYSSFKTGSFVFPKSKKTPVFLFPNVKVF